MIITDTLIHADGTVEEREIEVDEAYFNPPEQSESEDDVTVEQVINALLGVEA